MTQEKFYYDNKIVKLFSYATIFWGLVGMLIGLLAAAQLAFPFLNFELSFTTFGRVRPVHTNAIIFAFTGNAIFAGAYYAIQRLLKARLPGSENLSTGNLNFRPNFFNKEKQHVFSACIIGLKHTLGRGNSLLARIDRYRLT